MVFGGNNKQKTIFMMKEQLIREIKEIRKAQSDLRLRLNAVEDQVGRLPSQQLNLNEKPSFKISEKEPLKLFSFIKKLVLLELPAVQKTAREKDQSLEPPALPEISKVNVPTVTELTSSHPVTAISKESVSIKSESLELRFGSIWLVRIGIVVLLTGLVFLGNFAWTEFIVNFGPLGKLMLIYLAGLGLGAVGFALKTKYKSVKSYATVLMGGGIATIYYATYAAYFVEQLRVITNPLLGGSLLIMLAAVIIFLADRIRSEGIASVTIILGFYTAAINPMSNFSLFSNLLLSAMAITLLLRRKWLSVSFISLIGCYGSFIFWRIQTADWAFIDRFNNPQLFWTAFLFPLSYWVVFTVTAFLFYFKEINKSFRPAFLTINNGVFYALTALLVVGTYSNQFWLFTLSYGVLLIMLALLAYKLHPTEKDFDGSYFVQGLILIFVSLVLKLTGYQVALIFALQSGFLLRVSKYRHRIIFQIFSGLSAVIATQSSFHYLYYEHQHHSAIIAAGVALALLGIAWLLKFQEKLLKPLSFQWRSSGYILLATWLGVSTVFETMPGDHLLYWLLGPALLLMASCYLLKMPELIFAAQSVAVLALFEWREHLIYDHFPLLPFAAIVATFLVMLHWWQYQKLLVFGKRWLLVWQSCYSAALVMIIHDWVLIRFPQVNGVFPVVLCGFALLIYSFLTRAWTLAIASQLFSLLSAYTLVVALSEKSPWLTVVNTLMIFASQSLVITLLQYRIPESQRWIAKNYNQLLRALSTLLGLLTIKVYVPLEWQFLVFTAASFLLFGITVIISSKEGLAYAVVALLFGCWNFSWEKLFLAPCFSPDIEGFIMILLAQQIGKRQLKNYIYFQFPTQLILSLLGVFGLWLLLGRMVISLYTEDLLTMSWSLWSFIVLGMGFLLKERIYRILGLLILSVSIARLFCIDIWQLETIYRILSFLALGIMLLMLGFLYNRFSDWIRKWI